MIKKLRHYLPEFFYHNHNYPEVFSSDLFFEINILQNGVLKNV